MYSPKTTIAHDENMVFWAGDPNDIGNNGMNVIPNVATWSEPRDYGINVPVDLRWNMDPDEIRFRQGWREGMAVDTEAHGIGARLEDGDDAFSTNAGAQPGQRGSDSSRMVREVVVNSDIADSSAFFHASLDATESTEGMAAGRHGNARVARRANGAQGVLDIVLPEKFPIDLSRFPALMPDGEATAVIAYSGGSRRLFCSPCGGRSTKAFCRCPTAPVQHAPDSLVVMKI